MGECHQVFISYSHDTPEHKRQFWISQGVFATTALMRGSINMNPHRRKAGLDGWINKSRAQNLCS